MALYTSFDGSITRKPFWLGLLGLFAVGITIRILTVPLRQFGVWVGLLVSVALLYPALALTTKRLRGRANIRLWLGIYFVPGVLLNIAQALGIGFEQMTISGMEITLPTGWGLILSALAGIVALVALVDLGFLKGKGATGCIYP